MLSISASKAQFYDVLSYNINGTPVNGLNIKTNLPFTNSTQMVSLKIEGYAYGPSEIIDLNISWYIFGGVFRNTSISSAASYTPEVFLTNNNGLVNVFINDRAYFTRFRITAFAKGMSEQSVWFQGWTVADEAMQGTQVLNLAYKNNFRGTVTNEGNLYSMGNLGIGTTDTKGYKLAVNGKIRAQEIKVEATNWPDYVFAKDYKLPSLEETEKHIKQNGYLPGIPSAAEVNGDGIDLGEMDIKLSKKIEELTIHLIEKNKEITELKKLNKRVEQLELQIRNRTKNE
ncbi:hypothetical protein CPT03_16825 [Pedobacter ginsengisoli]|uniref:Uncharacterized protein n=1 Tax=Pedobacter ginsengisoli TaxID=363852 RepID=A0A2D1U8T5_9SPHI|nr:tail fiber protein [Pedobacter ginsengisoli]ATP58011.1 hypothetical protein CPT03_16825 [Pedobacter ginsengisoli]